MAEDIDAQSEAVAEEEEVSESAEDEEPSETSRRITLPQASLSDVKGLVLNVRMLRRIVQILFLLGINGYIFAAWYGNQAITDFWQSIGQVLPTLPILSPLEAPFAVIAGSFDTIQREFTSPAFPFFTFGAMIIILTILGRSACGWVCPLGTIQDFATLPNRNKQRLPPNQEQSYRRTKGYIFVLALFFALWVSVSKILGTAGDLLTTLGIFALAAFDPISPAHILFVEIPNMMEADLWPSSLETLWFVLEWDPFFWLQLVFVALVVLVSYWYPRWFCRWLCPAGWLYGYFSRDSLIGIGRNPALCTPDTCNTCEVVCPMNIRIRRFPYQHMYSADCIMCLECKSHCPNGAINIRFS